jgi:RNA recognition motif-containing protein
VEIARGSGPRVQQQRRGEFRLHITGLPARSSWQDLKDHMRRAGEVAYADLTGEGAGAVEYASRSDFEYALRKLDNTEMRNRFGETAIVRVTAADGSTARRSRSPRRSDRRSRSRSRSPARRADDGGAHSAGAAGHDGSGGVVDGEGAGGGGEGAGVVEGVQAGEAESAPA